MDTIASPGASISAPPGPRAAIAELNDARTATLELVDHIDAEDLERAHSPLMSPLVWDLAHIAAYEDLWLVHRHAGEPLLRPELAALYDAFETPRSIRGELELLDSAGARDYLQAVRARVIDALESHGIGDGVLVELVLRHELQHSETMRQTMAIAGLLPDSDRSKMEQALREPEEQERWIQIPAGAFSMGAHAHGFAYDNERPRHRAETGAFAIAALPVSNASWMRFSEEGGYEQRAWWSDEGWAFKQRYDITPHESVATAHPDAPVCHVSWFEADAFARAHDAQLPTEAQWEKAASSEEQTPRAIGAVWEWTRSHFGGYPGFEPYPYREYSEVFFGEDYRVLRGGSWATHPRVQSLTFRNWDLPQRRQIFAGVRLAREL
jgi:iron(II)-dependent oxidoreductase